MDAAPHVAAVVMESPCCWLLPHRLFGVRAHRFSCFLDEKTAGTSQQRGSSLVGSLRNAKVEVAVHPLPQAGSPGVANVVRRSVYHKNPPQSS